MMLDTLLDQLGWSSTTLILTVSVVFLASLARGFAGFGLSALTMAGLTLTIPPRSLIPMCILLEFIAGVLMAKGGFARANLKVSWGLAIFSSMGLPLGLLATVSISIQQSTIVALVLILFLALMQLFKTVPEFLGTTAGLYLSGFAAGIAAGLASVGGLVVALFVLAQRAPPTQMRASLVVYLFLTLFTTLISLTISGLLDAVAFKRALALTPVVIAGVGIGSWLFRPALEHWYKRLCLCLLMGLAIAGLVRLSLSAH